MTRPASSQPSPVQPAAVQRFPVRDPDIQAVAAQKAGLSAQNWQKVVASREDEYYPSLDSDDETELAAIFNMRQRDLDVAISDQNRIASSAKVPSLLALDRDDILKVKQQWAVVYGEGLRPLPRK